MANADFRLRSDKGPKIRGSLRGVWIKGAVNRLAFGIPSFGIPAFGTPVSGIPDFGIPGFGIPGFGISVFRNFSLNQTPLIRHPLDSPQENAGKRAQTQAKADKREQTTNQRLTPPFTHPLLRQPNVLGIRKGEVLMAVHTGNWAHIPRSPRFGVTICSICVSCSQECRNLSRNTATYHSRKNYYRPE